MPLSNSTIAGGVFGAAAGGLVGVMIGKNLADDAPHKPGEDPPPFPEFLGLLGAIAGGVLFAAFANSAATQTTTVTTNSNTVSDNTQNANGVTTLPPAGA